ncbi:protein phosphatase 2C 70-like isoform X2 [Arachis ipaensis]|uniref:protein phosphatase 2C 70-like isoform X2 n=1 Tax=Arachis ipaensis TaxID=130454 RepID=UPI000A2B30A2|nr:protein phosphatase 2C 70-like isoform X2 [Arachis ipaensis]
MYGAAVLDAYEQIKVRMEPVASWNNFNSFAEVHVAAQNQQRIPFGVGMASDPMALRRGAKQLAMEDVCYYQWPLPGLDQFGLFGICDGAAKSASKERILSLHDASEILRDAFSQTEACLNHY